MTNTTLKAVPVTRLLKQMTRSSAKGQLTCGNLVQRLGGQGFGLALILFALPSALPISFIPGFSFIFGLPIVFIALHLIIRRKSVWLPSKLANHTIDKGKFIRIIKKTLPYLISIEHLLRPRWVFFSTPVMEVMHGIILLLLSLILLLPIPFSNFILAVLIIGFGFGISEKDGLLLAVTYLASISYFIFLVYIVRVITFTFT